MEYVVVCCVALLASGLTLFSGFGLGTLLLPAFLFFFSPELAVAMTAIVHFANNLLKLGLYGRMADRTIVTRFGIPAVASSFLGVWVLLLLSSGEPWIIYSLPGREAAITPLKVLLAVLILSFAVLESMPLSRSFHVDMRWLPLGGLLSGFFGGLSGHQGTLRSLFLVHANLGKEAFIATGVVIACLIDATRIAVYGRHVASSGIHENVGIVAAAILSVLAGVFLARKVSHAVTMNSVQRIVAGLLFVIAIGLGAGIL